MEKVAVLPVPDWAWAMTSWPGAVSDAVVVGGGVKLTLDDGHDGALLDSRGTLETVGVDTTEELSLEVHVVEGVGGLIVVGLDLACAGSACAQTWTGTFCMSRARLTVRRWRAASMSQTHGSAQRTAHRGSDGDGATCRDRQHSPSGTSSRPLSAMIASCRGVEQWGSCGYRRCWIRKLFGGEARYQILSARIKEYLGVELCCGVDCVGEGRSRRGERTF
jgi:hypothetical protein